MCVAESCGHTVQLAWCWPKDEGSSIKAPQDLSRGRVLGFSCARGIKDFA